MRGSAIRLLVEANVFLWNPKRGIPRVYREILSRLCTAFPDIDVHLAIQGAIPVPECEKWGAHVARVPCLPPGLKPWRLRHLAAPFANSVLARGFWRRQRSVDVYHTTTYALPPTRGPTSCVVHDMIPEVFPAMFPGAGWRRLQRLKMAAIRRAGTVLCVSENTRADVVRICGVPLDRCRVVYNGGYWDVDAGSRLGASDIEQKPFLLYVGGHRTPYKNFRHFLECIGTAFEGLQVIVVGPEQPTSKELSSYEGIVGTDRLTFRTDCSDQMLRTLYCGCAAFVLPSLYEGFGIPVVEALSCGAPVACSNAASLPEVGGDVVHYFSPRSREELRSALTRALAEGRAEATVERRRAHASRFSWDRTAEAFAASVRELAHGSQTGGRR